MGFYNRVYDEVKKIPKGNVATYGQIAQILGTRYARKVGWALHANHSPSVPCHRVVNKEGSVSDSYSFGGYKEQKYKLLEEGVPFVDEKRVNLDKCRYFDKC